MIDFRNREVLNKLIQVEHWEQGRSLRAIERHYGMTKTILSWWCRRHEIPVRTRSQSIIAYAATDEGKANRPRGEHHWCYGLRKETSAFMQRHSERMTRANPATDYAIMTQMSAGRALYLRQNPTAREQMVMDLLPLDTMPDMIFQYPVGIYILDFAFPAYHVALEIDGTTHRRADRIAHDTIRTQALIEAGWILLRHEIALKARHPKGWDLTRVGQILETLIPDLQLVYPEPPDRRSKYGVLVCCQEYPAGIRAYNPHDPRLIALAHRIRHTTPAPAMREDQHASPHSRNIEQSLFSHNNGASR
jgi:very-short-patch-repair endonuclease